MPKFFKGAGSHSEPEAPEVDPREDVIPPPGEETIPEPPGGTNPALPVPPADQTDADHQIGQGSEPVASDPAVLDPLGHLDDVADEQPPTPGAGLPDEVPPAPEPPPPPPPPAP